MSGKSKEEVAFELVAKLKGVGVWGENNMVAILDMYAECLEATSGLRSLGGKTPSALKLPGHAAAPIAATAPALALAPAQAAAPAVQQAVPRQHAPLQQPVVRQPQQLTQPTLQPQVAQPRQG